MDADGGADICEAVFDGIKEVISLNWTDSVIDVYGGIQRIVFMIGDAPPHGLQYHSKELNDDYEKGCPCGLDFTELCMQIRLKDISFNIVEINNAFNKNQMSKFNYKFGN